jgi:hypothetical protein
VAGPSRWRGGRYRVYSLKRRWSLEELTLPPAHLSMGLRFVASHQPDIFAVPFSHDQAILRRA